MAGVKRVNARMATLAVLDILQKQTDRNHKLHIMDIVRRLKMEPYFIVTQRDTVKKILRDLQEFYSVENCIRCEVTNRVSKKGEEIDEYTYNYYFEKRFSNEEIQFLIDDVMFSHMRTVSQVKELTKKLKTLVTKDFSKKLGYIDQVPDKQYTINEQTQENIALIHHAILQNAPSNHIEVQISFTFNGYGTDKKLHPTNNYRVLPLRICVANQRYYLICYLQGMQYLSHFRIDLMTALKEEKVFVEKDEKKQMLINSLTQKTISEYLSAHLYMFYENRNNTVKNVTLRITKIPWKPDASLTFLYDAFGTNWSVVKGTETEKYVDVQVKCVPSAMKLFVRQYMDYVDVLEPSEIKEQIECEITEDFKNYIKKRGDVYETIS